MAKSVTDVVASLTARRDTILDILNNPCFIRPDDSFEGQSINYSSWRSGLMQELDSINTQLNNYDPVYIISQAF